MRCEVLGRSIGLPAATDFAAVKPPLTRSTMGPPTVLGSQVILTLQVVVLRDLAG